MVLGSSAVAVTKTELPKGNENFEEDDTVLKKSFTVAPKQNEEFSYSQS